MINASASNTNNKNIVHIMHNDKFNGDYIKFINENFPPREHLFIFVANAVGEMFPIPPLANVKKLFCSRKRFYNYFWLLYYCIRADKIILHGLFVPQIVKFLYINRYLLKKCYWVLWGGDFYDDVNNDCSGYASNLDYQKYRTYKYFVAKNIYGFITYLEGDYNLAKKHYVSSALYFECLSYLSNLVRKFECNSRVTNKELNILVGNSATSTNNHTEVFNLLKEIDLSKIKIICPLAYGDEQYRTQIIEYASKLFGNIFNPIAELTASSAYYVMLGNIDIAIFNHSRQGAMGNIITLLGMGKTVYIKQNTSPAEFFNRIGIKTFNVDSISEYGLEKLDDLQRESNIKIMQTYFNESTLLFQWQNIFNFLEDSLNVK